MNKTAIKNFAVWARRKLIAEITYKAGLLGITEKGIAEPLPQSAKGLQFFDIGTKDYTQITGNEIIQRDALVQKIREKEKSLNSSHASLSAAFQAVVEEVAYTWFNRLIAVRFMEVNDYLPSGIRVLSSADSAKQEPDFVTTPFNTDLDFSDYDRDRVMQLKDENKLDELFRMLFIKQCNKLGEILPELFENTEDYTELLLNISFTDKDGVLYRLTHDIEEEDFKEAVEIIGWLYQFYNTEPKDETFALLKKNVKITKERIPSATQLFTPDWIVRYMVENSLGRLWIEHLQSTSDCFSFNFNVEPADIKHIDKTNINLQISSMKSNWMYYLDEAKQEPDVENQIAKLRVDYRNMKPEDIRLIDPCMGSGHILVYAFDVLMQIYLAYGYAEHDAVKSILQNNIYGLDIDKRAYQLTCFALFMKARSYDRRFFMRGENGCRNAPLHVEYFEESNSITNSDLDLMITLSQKIPVDGLDKPMDKDDVDTLNYLYDTFKNANEYGSIINVEEHDYKKLAERLMDISYSYEPTLDTIHLEKNIGILLHMIQIAEVVARKYDVVVTNPPYMGSSGMSPKLSEYVQRDYPENKSDLFAVFINKGNKMVVQNGYNCMVTMQSWMFLSSFEVMRKSIIATKTITNLMHMENMVMGIAFGTAVTVFKNNHIMDFVGTYNQIKLCDIDENDKPKVFPVKGNRFAQVNSENFSQIPGAPIAYWVSEDLLSAFKNGEVLKKQGDTRQGMATSDNNRFLRLWYEVGFHNIGLNCKSAEDADNLAKKWFPYNKGGQFRKWYGNIDYIINYENNGAEVKQYATDLYKTASRTIKSISEYFKDCLSWSKVSSGSIAFRYYPYGFIFDVAGCCIFYNDIKHKYYDFAFLNSKISKSILSAISPTLNYEAGQIASLPIIFDNEYSTVINSTVQNNIAISKIDWDSFETSWDFIKHPFMLYGYQNDYGLVNYKNANIVPPLQYDYEKGIFEIIKGEKKSPNQCLIEECFNAWSKYCDDQFNNLKNNEQELNRIFIEIYSLQDELTPEVEDKDIKASCRKADLGREIRSLISYAVGCMFGRYSPDVEGLAYAGGEWDGSKYFSFIPDADNCIPITDEEYFTDDIAGRFIEFVKVVYGAETLEENLDFIADALGNKGNSSREVIRSYLLNDFYKDHFKIYQKRPIYWLFDSGKENGFKSLIYMHRYNEDTIGNLRIEYLHRIQKVYESEIARMQETIDNSADSREVAAAEKRKDKLTRQLKETKDYDAKIAHLALARIIIDLDDGVKVNYEKIQTDADGKVLDVLAKI